MVGNRSVWLGAASAAVVAAVLGAPAARAAEADAAGASQLSEVVVTATKREESLQRVPVSVTAISADQLKQLDATTLRDLQFSVPNFVYGGESTARRPDIALRGIDSATRVPGFEGSIGFFVDGVYEPFPDQWDNPIVDVDRVEVIYGPQSALFGKNTVAGAISITTRKPSDHLDGFLQAEGGSYSDASVRGYVDVPLVDGKLFLRLSAYKDHRDGYVTNIYDGHKLDDLNQAGGRIQLRYRPSDRFESNFSFDYYNQAQAELQAQTVGGKYSTGNPRTVNINTDPKTSRFLYNANLTNVWSFGGGATLTSITAGSVTRAKYTTDEDANPVNQWFTNIVDHTSDFSQELRYASAKGGKFDYIGGLYYLNSHWSQPGSIQTLPGDPDNDPGGLGVLNPDGSVNYSDAVGKRVDSNSYAAYADVNYHLTDKLTIEAGLRVTHDDKYLAYPGQLAFGASFLNLCKLGRSLGAGCLIPGGAYPVEPAYQDSLGETQLTEGGGMNYQLTPDVLLYWKIGTGYKAGGWNSDLTHSYPPNRFSPEHLINYEVGAKSEFFDHHLRLNGDLFWDDYQNKQETVFVSITQGFVISNAASATIKGLEASANALVGDFTLNGGVGYIDPKYDNFACAQGVNCAGQQLVFATKVTASGSVEFHHRLGSLGRLSLQADVSYRSRLYLAVPNVIDESVAGYTLFDTRAALTLPDNRTEVYVLIKNAGDRTYETSHFPGDPAYPGFGSKAAVLYGPPRMIVAGVSHRF